MGKVLVGLVLGAIIAVSAVYALRDDKDTARETTVNFLPAAEADLDEMQAVTSSPPLERAAVDEIGSAAGMVPPASTDAEPSTARPEFDALFKSNPVMAAQHTLFEKEARDHLWASDVESKFQQVLASNFEVQRYGQPEVECRSSRCEVRLLAYGASDVRAEDWPSILSLKSVFFDADGNRINSPMDPPAMINTGVAESGEASALVLSLLFQRPR